MEITASKIAALLVALAYIVVAFGFGAPLKVLALFCLVLAVPLGLIWFPDECGGITGTVSRIHHTGNAWGRGCSRRLVSASRIPGDRVPRYSQCGQGLE